MNNPTEAHPPPQAASGQPPGVCDRSRAALTMKDEEMMSFNFGQLNVGDPVVIKHRSCGDDGPYEKATIEKVTKTSVNAGGIRFNARTGFEWGHSLSWSYTPTRLVDRDWKTPLSYEEADTLNLEWRQKRDYNRLVNEIRDTSFRSLSLETLQAIKALIDADVAKRAEESAK